MNGRPKRFLASPRPLWRLKTFGIVFWGAFWGALGLTLSGIILNLDQAQAQKSKNVDAMVTGFGRTCTPPAINLETFGRELWEARGLVLVDILMADGPGESLFGFVFDTDEERFKATFPEFAAKTSLKLANGWTATRSITMTRFKDGNMEGSQIPRPMLLCQAKMP